MTRPVEPSGNFSQSPSGGANPARRVRRTDAAMVVFMTPVYANEIWFVAPLEIILQRQSLSALTSLVGRELQVGDPNAFERGHQGRDVELPFMFDDLRRGYRQRAKEKAVILDAEVHGVL